MLHYDRLITRTTDCIGSHTRHKVTTCDHYEKYNENQSLSSELKSNILLTLNVIKEVYSANGIDVINSRKLENKFIWQASDTKLQWQIFF